MHIAMDGGSSKFCFEFANAPYSIGHRPAFAGRYVNHYPSDQG